MAACILSGQGVFAEGTRVPASKLALVVGRETTFITEPLSDDGYPDYVAALNLAARKDVAREDNFWAKFLEVTGREQDFSDEFVDSVSAELQIRIPDRFQIKRLQEVVDVDRDDLPTLYERLAWAMTHPWERADAPAVAKWLDENDAVMEGIRAAARRPKAYCPIVRGRPFGLIDARLPHVNQCRVCSHLFAARAMQHLKAGRAQAAFDDLLTVYRIAGHLERGRSSIQRYMAAAHRKAAHVGMGCWLAHCRMSREELHENWDELKPLLTNPGAADPVLPERFEFLETALAIGSHAASFEDFLPAPPPLDPIPRGNVLQGMLQALGRVSVRALLNRIYTPRDINAVLRYGNERFDEIAEATTSRNPVERAKRCAVIAESTAREQEQLGNPLGLLKSYFLASRDQANLIPARWMYYMLVPALLETEQHRSEDESRSACVAAAFLLQGEIAAHGSSADRIDEMIRLDRFPKDPYAVTPLKVRREKDRIVIYSIGANGRDDSEDPEDIEADDVRFTIGIEEE